MLTVEIEGQRRSTINWSVRGLLLEEYHGDLRPGDQVKIHITAEGYSGGGKCWVRVVRRVPKRGELALDFADISTIILNLMHEMKQAGVRPEPG
ncbi:hypothetical protein CCP1ISM_2080002 [Azospirillaceae bacterium]